ncbi:hypothetical protein KKD03_03195 [Patescibacteria group bacterium]|nr:hypothetical protein [Patescibacteria group bacterium]
MVEKSFISPHFADHIAYQRVGRTSQKLSAQEIEKYISQRNTVSFDNTALLPVKIENISIAKVKEFLDSINKNYPVNSYLLSRNCLKQESAVSSSLPTFNSYSCRYFTIWRGSTVISHSVTYYVS